jgi:hypothetical protein
MTRKKEESIGRMISILHRFGQSHMGKKLGTLQRRTGSEKRDSRSPWHEYMELLLSSVPEMDPDWLDNLLAERQAEA